jgi:hypothetical protein
MATKKAAPPPNPDLDIVDEDGFLCLKGNRLWKWRALEAELRAELLELDSVKQRIQIEISKNPELPPLLTRQAELASSISQAKAEVLGLQGEIEQLFGVSLKECAFDDKTGRLYNLSDGGERGDPVKPKISKRSPRKTSAPKGK